MYLNKCMSTTAVVHAALNKNQEYWSKRLFPNVAAEYFARELDFHIRLQSRYRLLLSIDTEWLSTYAHAYV